jgi:hypothetical protein
VRVRIPVGILCTTCAFKVHHAMEVSSATCIVHGASVRSNDDKLKKEVLLLRKLPIFRPRPSLFPNLRNFRDSDLHQQHANGFLNIDRGSWYAFPDPAGEVVMMKIMEIWGFVSCLKRTKGAKQDYIPKKQITCSKY